MLTKKDDINIINDIQGNAKPILNIAKLGIVSRDYRHEFKNGFRDFSSALPEILKLLDDIGCDAVLFSLFSIIPQNSYTQQVALQALKNIKAVFLEEFEDSNEKRTARRYVVLHAKSGIWDEYEFEQKFGTLTGTPKHYIDEFVKNEMPKRIMGNCAVLLCGESNGVKYSSKDKKVHDIFGLQQALSRRSKIILNPIHDRMTRYEMKIKRKFLSENDRWVISVWNKGKSDKNGLVRDGKAPAWTVFCNGEEITIHPIDHSFSKIEIGVVDIAKP